MTRSTVSRLVDDLITGGLVAEGTAVGGVRGRPAVPLSVRRGSIVALGIEVNVERIVASVVDLTGEPIAVRVIDMHVRSMALREVMATVNKVAMELLREVPVSARITGAVLAVPGLVDRVGRTIVRSPNLTWEGQQPPAWWDVSIHGTPIPLRIANDIDCSALTVMREVPGESFLYVTGEVGIGASVSLDGELQTGRHGWASELGHFCVEPTGVECGCGAVGCLETIAGLHTLLADADQPNMAALLQALADGDERSLAAIDRLARVLGIAIGAALNLLDVPNVRLGGHLGRLGAWLNDPLRRELDTRVLWARQSGIDVQPVERVLQRAAVGAGLAGLAGVFTNPASWIEPILHR